MSDKKAIDEYADYNEIMKKRKELESLVEKFRSNTTLEITGIVKQFDIMGSELSSLIKMYTAPTKLIECDAFLSQCWVCKEQLERIEKQLKERQEQAQQLIKETQKKIEDLKSKVDMFRNNNSARELIGEFDKIAGILPGSIVVHKYKAMTDAAISSQCKEFMQQLDRIEKQLDNTSEIRIEQWREKSKVIPIVQAQQNAKHLQNTVDEIVMQQILEKNSDYGNFKPLMEVCRKHINDKQLAEETRACLQAIQNYLDIIEQLSNGAASDFSYSTSMIMDKKPHLYDCINNNNDIHSLTQVVDDLRKQLEDEHIASTITNNQGNVKSLYSLIEKTNLFDAAIVRNKQAIEAISITTNGLVRIKEQVKNITDKKILEKLAHKYGGKIRQAVAANPNTDADTLKYIAQTTSTLETLVNVVNNPNFKDAAELKKLAHKYGGKIRQAVAANPNTDADTLKYIAQTTSTARTLFNVVNNQNLTNEILQTVRKNKITKKETPEAEQIMAAIEIQSNRLNQEKANKNTQNTISHLDIVAPQLNLNSSQKKSLKESAEQTTEKPDVKAVIQKKPEV